MSYPRITREHRGLRHYEWTWRQTTESLVLVVGLTLLAGFCAPWVSQAWVDVLQWAWPRLELGAATDVRGVQFMTDIGLPWTRFEVTMAPHFPSRVQWWVLTLGALLVLVLTMRMSRERLPLIYLLRVVAMLVLFSTVAFEFFTADVNADPSRLVIDVLSLGIYLIWCFPAVHALVMHIFPMRIWLKVTATLCALAFIAISVPLQAGTLALLAQHGSSLTIMPLYMLATFLPQLVAQLAIYGYFMSLTRPISSLPTRVG